MKQAIELSQRNKQETGAQASEQSVPVATFEIRHTRFLNALGRVTQPLPEFAQNPENLVALYRIMRLIRVFDNRAVSLQRTGQLGTYASSLGQEAIGAAIGSVMRKDDVLIPAYREYAAQYMRGVSMTEILLYWGGNECGMDFKGPRHDFPICVPIASQVPHAVGVAYAMKLRREARVAVCVLGDGATSKGDFYEAINAAGVWQLPVVFVVNNNEWAISVPRGAQTHAETLAQKAIAAGFSGEQADGNDVIAMRYCVERALGKARQGGGPSLIEAQTYRLCDHTTADDASRYRSDEALTKAWQAEPLLRLQAYLRQAGVWSEQDEAALTETCRAAVETAVKDYLATPVQGPGSLFDYLYESVPEALLEQRRSVMQRSARNA